MMVVLGARGRQNTHDSDDEIEVNDTYHGEEEEMEGDDENENDSDDAQNPKEILRPLLNISPIFRKCRKCRRHFHPPDMLLTKCHDTSDTIKVS
jgi:hypothetical protein